jgi:hypothetical protein
MPFTYTSPNAIPQVQTLLAFMISMVAGDRRLVHTDRLRAGKALRALLGIERFPGTDTVRNLFLRFRQGHIEEFWRPHRKWLLALSWPVPPEHTAEKNLGKAIWEAIVAKMKHFVILPYRPYSDVWRGVFPTVSQFSAFQLLRKCLFGFEKLLRLDSYYKRHTIDISLVV